MESIGQLLNREVLMRACSSAPAEKTTERARYKCPDIEPEKIAKILGIFYRDCTSATERDYDVQWARKNCTTIARWLTNAEAKKGLIICGGMGTAKTTITKALCAFFFNANVNCFRFNATDIAQNVLHNRDFFDRYICGGTFCDFLIIDDLGTEDVTVNEYGNTMTPFSILVNARYDKGLPLVITTNLDMNEIAQRYGERTEDRLKQMCERMVMNRESFRK